MWWFFSDFGGRIEIFIGFFNTVGDGDGGIRRAGEEFSLIFMMNLILFSVLPTGMYNQVSQSVSISRVLMFTRHIFFWDTLYRNGQTRVSFARREMVVILHNYTLSRGGNQT